MSSLHIAPFALDSASLSWLIRCRLISIIGSARNASHECMAAGVPQAKQKSHKKKKREIDKPAMATTTPSGIKEWRCLSLVDSRAQVQMALQCVRHFCRQHVCMPTGHLGSVGQEQTQIGKTVDAGMNGSVKKKKRKKDKGSTGPSGSSLAFCQHAQALDQHIHQ